MDILNVQNFHKGRDKSSNGNRLSVAGSLRLRRRFIRTKPEGERWGVARVALCQFPVSEDKDENHKTASDYLNRAAEKGAKLAVLPEIWNGPYATSAFEEYSEVLPDVGDTSADDSPSTQLLMKHAKETGMWVVGGSIPESDDGKIYNTCLVIDPSGKVVAKHRKVHLFDIDVPGGITFFESDTLSPGETMTAFDGGDDFGMIGVGIWCVCIRPQRIERLIL
jgi:omega-amidase